MIKSIAKIVGYALVVLFLAAAVGFIYKFTNGFNEDFKTFYVECDGRQILTADNEMTFTAGNVYKFDVKYTFDKADAEPKGYSVKVVPNADKDFEFTVDGATKLFSKETDLTAGFEIEMGDTSFEIYFPEGMTIQSVLSKLYEGKTVSVPELAERDNSMPFMLIIGSYNEKVIYNIAFNVSDAEIETNYSIEYLFSGDATNLSGLSVTGTTQAKAGENASFTVIIGDSQYAVTGVSISVLNSSEIVQIKQQGESYSFTMPQGSVYVWIYFEYTPVEDKTFYSLEYDSLGWGSILVLDLNCPGKAEAGAIVTFTAKIKDEYASEYKISRIAVELGSGEEYIDELRGDGEYAFTMPDMQTLETNEGYVTLMFYIVPVDM